jgi:hypothetical protein
MIAEARIADPGQDQPGGPFNRAGHAHRRKRP